MGCGRGFMDQGTLRFATAAAIILATVTIAVSAFAESGQYQRPAAPVDSNDRLPAVIQFEQFLDKSGVTGLNNVNGQPGAQPVQPAPMAQPIQPQPEPVILILTAPAVSVRSAPPPRRDTAAPVSMHIPASSSASAAGAVETASPASDPTAAMAAPAQDAATLYAPPVRSPWWERLLSSREFLYAAAFCLIAAPVAGFAASSLIGRRREERDLALYD